MKRDSHAATLDSIIWFLFMQFMLECPAKCAIQCTTRLWGCTLFERAPNTPLYTLKLMNPNELKTNNVQWVYLFITYRWMNQNNMIWDEFGALPILVITIFVNKIEIMQLPDEIDKYAQRMSMSSIRVRSVYIVCVPLATFRWCFISIQSFHCGFSINSHPLRVSTRWIEWNEILIPFLEYLLLTNHQHLWGKLLKSISHCLSEHAWVYEFPQWCIFSHHLMWIAHHVMQSVIDSID